MLFSRSRVQHEHITYRYFCFAKDQCPLFVPVKVNVKNVSGVNYHGILLTMMACVCQDPTQVLHLCQAPPTGNSGGRDWAEMIELLWETED